MALKDTTSPCPWPYSAQDRFIVLISSNLDKSQSGGSHSLALQLPVPGTQDYTKGSRHIPLLSS